jgi:hypothetical protein
VEQDAVLIVEAFGLFEKVSSFSRRLLILQRRKRTAKLLRSLVEILEKHIITDGQIFLLASLLGIQVCNQPFPPLNGRVMFQDQLGARLSDLPDLVQSEQIDRCDHSDDREISNR